MADNNKLTPDPNSMTPYLQAGAAALTNDRGAFYEFMGLSKDGPGFSEWFSPHSPQAQRYNKADDLFMQTRQWGMQKAAEQQIQQRNTPSVEDTLAQYPGLLQPLPSQTQTHAFNVDRNLVPDTFDIDKLQRPEGYGPSWDLAQNVLPPLRPPAENFLEPLRAGPLPDATGEREISLDLWDKRQKLTPMQQGVLHARQAQSALRPPAASTPAVGAQQYQDGLRAAYEDFQFRNRRLPNPTEAYAIQQRASDQFLKQPETGTPLDTINQADAKTRDKKNQAEIDEKNTKAEENHAIAEDIWSKTVLGQQKLKAETNSLDAGVGFAEQRVKTAEDKVALAQIEQKLALWRNTVKWGELSAKSKKVILGEFMQDIFPGVEVTEEKQNWFKSLIPWLEPKMTVTFPPAGSPASTPSQEEVPASPPSGVTPPVAPKAPMRPAPQPSSSPATGASPTLTAPDALEELRELNQRMREGDVITYKGTQYTKRNGKFGKLN